MLEGAPRRRVGRTCCRKRQSAAAQYRVRQTAHKVAILEENRSGADTYLRLERVSRSYGPTKALTDLSMSAESGTVHSILGENGSGKSTTVKILSGILPPDGGRVVVGGREIRRFSPQDAAAAAVATVFQELLNVPNRSVTENILLGQPGWVRHTYSARQRRDIAKQQLARLGIGNVSTDYEVGNLPLSSQQLVAIARALAREPRILILDESTSALDVDARDRLFDVLQEELRKGVLILFISHRIDEILQLARAVTVLRNGRVANTFTGVDITEENLMDAMSIPAPMAADV